MKTRPKRSARAAVADGRAALLARKMAAARLHVRATHRAAESAKKEFKRARKLAKQAKRAAKAARQELKALKRTRGDLPLNAKKKTASTRRQTMKVPAKAQSKPAPDGRANPSAAAPAAYEFGTEPTITPWGR